MKPIGAVGLCLLAVLQLSLIQPAAALSAANTLDAGTRLYVSLDQKVSSARGGDDVGTIVRCRVWRDVENRGVVFIKAGTPATCRVDKVSRRNIGGFEGKVSVAGVDTRSVDGQEVILSGGYNKEGSGHKAAVLTVGLLLLWPVLFIPGGNAELPPGTVIDVSTVNVLRLEEAQVAAAPRVVNLSSLGTGLSAEFMIDDFIAQPRHDTFRIKLSRSGEIPAKLVIDNVNGKPVEPLSLTLSDVSQKDGEGGGVAQIPAKTLAKYFARGINRFDVAYTEDGQRKATEVIMDVQM